MSKVWWKKARTTDYGVPGQNLKKELRCEIQVANVKVQISNEDSNVKFLNP